MTQSIIQIVSGAIGVAGFAIGYNIQGKKLLFTTIGGAFSWALFLLFQSFGYAEAICYFFVSVIVSVYSEILARKFKTPTTTFAIPSLIPLIPGSSLYYTIASAFEGHKEMFFDKFVDTLMLAAALALGIIIVSVAMGIILRLKTKHHALIFKDGKGNKK